MSDHLFKPISDEALSCAREGMLQLTPQELEALKGILEGISATVDAARPGRPKYRTIEAQRAMALKRMGAKNAMIAIRLATILEREPGFVEAMRNRPIHLSTYWPSRRNPHLPSKRGTNDDPKIVPLPPDVRAAIDHFIAEEHPRISRSEAMLMVFRDWAIAHGYLEQPPEREDMH